MQFVFKGVPGESHASVNMYGTEFALGVPTDIGDAKFIAKLAIHPHFETVAPAEAEPEAEVEDLPPTLDELKAEAVALGIVVKGNWGAKKLGEEIAKAKA